MMLVPRSVLACSIAVLYVTSALVQPSQCQRTVNVEPWRMNPSAVVLGETLYVMGGMTCENSSIWEAEERTVALPLDRPWDFGAVRASDTTGFAATEGLAVWPSLGNQTILSWGGMDLWINTLDPLRTDPNKSFAATPRLQAFRPASSGSARGSWAPASDTPPTDFESAQRIHRTRFGAWASCNGFGFHMGGQVRYGTDSTYKVPSPTDQGYLPGLIIYDMKKDRWTNRTATGFGSGKYEGTYMHGQAVCLPTLGTGGQGLVVFIGGYHCVTDGVGPAGECNRRDGSGKELDMGRIIFYDIGTGKFHAQNTTGPSPTPRERHCSVVAKADNSNAYEIIVFGGVRQIPAETFVLTIPGFRWFRAQDSMKTPVARAYHACAILGGAGARQMVAVGGVDEYEYNAFNRADPWMPSQHMQILDMTALKWNDTYRHDAPKYQQPGLVKEWYSNKTNLDAIEWEGPDTRALFAAAVDGIKASPISPSTPENPPASGSQSTGLAVGVIVGAALGGLAGLGVLATGLWCFCRYRGQQRSAAEQHASETTKIQPWTAPAEMWVSPPELYDEGYGARPPQELHDPRPPQELWGSPVPR